MSKQQIHTLQEEIAILRAALSDIGSTAATALLDEGVRGWDEGGRLGDALLYIKDTVEEALTDEGRQVLEQQYHIGKERQNQSSTLHQSAEIFRDTMAEARITSENITDTQQQKAVYAEVTAIVQETLETLRNKPLPDTPTGQQLREEIERRNRRFLPEAQDEKNL